MILEVTKVLEKLQELQLLRRFLGPLEKELPVTVFLNTSDLF